jgi:L,D-transpeptidase-like protein
MRGLPSGLMLACVIAAGSPAAVAPAVAGAAPRTVRPLDAAHALGNELLSDEARITRFAGAVDRAAVRSAPSPAARRVASLRYLTEDGPFEVYPVLESLVDAGGRTWLRIRLPMRPNGTTGWVRRESLGPLRTVRTMLRVNRATLRATLYRDGRRVWSSPVGIGAASTPTPRGQFWIRSRIRVLRDNPAYGPWAFGTGAYSVLSDWPGGGVIGVHGTDEPQLVPGRPSHGCVRVPNAAIKRLKRLMPVGTPVTIL